MSLSIIPLLISLISIIWSLPFILLPFFNYQIYKISNQKMVNFLNEIPKLSSINNNDTMEGWIIGKWYVGYINIIYTSQGDQKKELYLLTSNERFNNINKIKNSDNINLWEREGNYFSLQYYKRDFKIVDLIATQQQANIINNIIKFYKKNKYNIVLLHGKKGTGKSMIPLLLAKKLHLYNKKINNAYNINLCDTFKPTDPGDNFISLYNKINPTKKSPLIVVIEEFDIMIHKIHEGNILNHKYITININDKTSWNQFFDRFDRKYYPWVIIILTSNVSPDIINSLDPSYIRPGRITQIFETTEETTPKTTLLTYNN